MSKPIPRGNKDKKQRLNLPLPPVGNADGLITADEFAEYHKNLLRWADGLQLARVGWHAISSDGYHSVGAGTNRLQFDRTLEDSKSFTRRIMPASALNMFQVPEDQGGVYNVSWSLEWRGGTFTTTTLSNTSNLRSDSTFTVPAGVTSIHVIIDGGSGNPNGVLVYHGGTGGRVEADIAVTPGQVYQITAGGSGLIAPSTASCTPGGGPMNVAGGYHGLAGGGYSFIKHNGDPDSAALVIAGAGGGGGNQNTGADSPKGGDGGGLTGQDGTTSDTRGLAGFDPQSFGKGGTAAAGGIAGVGFGGSQGGDGSALQGGDGAGGPGSGASGGGGGWFGGGSGTVGRNNLGNICTSGAGGGSSHTTGCTGVIHTQGGALFGTSKVVISYFAAGTLTPTDLAVQVIVSRYNWQTNAHYVKQEMISADQGYQYLHGAINMYLDPRDRVYVQTVNTSAGVVQYLGEHTRLSVNLVGN